MLQFLLYVQNSPWSIAAHIATHRPVLCQVLSLALFAAVANADPGGGPAPGALELGGLAAGGADFDLDDGDADAAWVLGLSG